MSQAVSPAKNTIMDDECVMQPYQRFAMYCPNRTSTGAMAAPMLLASLMPLSFTRPMVTRATRGPGRIWLVTITAPAAVAVHWEIGRAHV